VPLQGRGTKGPNWGEGEGVRVLVFDVPAEPSREDWPVEVAESSLHTAHNLQIFDVNGDRRDDIVVACWEGVFVLDRSTDGRWSKTQIGLGNQDSKPFKGSSEVKVGKLNGRTSYVATIEPWHGFQVVIYTQQRTNLSSPSNSTIWSRQVIAEPLQWGHAVWTANLDDDDDDELLIGQRREQAWNGGSARTRAVCV
jgi:hypothetical protein